MKMVFIAPRMHTNQNPIVEGLLDRNIQVQFYTFYKGAVEDYTKLVPIMLKQNVFSKLFGKLFDKKYTPDVAELKKLRWYMPSFLNVVKMLKKEKPDLLVLRERSKANAVICVACKVIGFRNVIIYNQTPMHVRYRGWKNLIFFPVRYTPVKGLLDNKVILNQPPEHTYFAPFVYKPSTCEKRYPREGDVIRILDVGKYRDYKNHFLFVEAIKLLTQRNICNIHVTIVGQVSNSSEERYFNDLSQFVQDLNLQDYISLKNNVPYKLMDAVYQENDILVLPSKKEVAGMVIIESMANGLCTISTDNNGTACYVIESGGGSVFDYRSSESLATVLEKYICSANSIQNSGLMGKKYIREYCSIEKYLETINLICEKEFNFSIMV